MTESPITPSKRKRKNSDTLDFSKVTESVEWTKTEQTQRKKHPEKLLLSLANKLHVSMSKFLSQLKDVPLTPVLRQEVEEALGPHADYVLAELKQPTAVQSLPKLDAIMEEMHKVTSAITEEVQEVKDAILHNFRITDVTQLRDPDYKSIQTANLLPVLNKPTEQSGPTEWFAAELDSFCCNSSTRDYLMANLKHKLEVRGERQEWDVTLELRNLIASDVVAVL